MTERVERRLAAILAADVAGYSRLMGTDEEGTLARLKAIRRELVDPAMARHRGRVFKTTGDGLLAEFASVVDAARCALEVQRAMAEREAGEPEDRRIRFRVGVHLGDVMADEGDVFGDGVNVAARLQELGPPGGLALSEDALRQVRGRLDVAFADLGERRLKNIAHPVRLHAWRPDGALKPAAGGWRKRALAAAGAALLLTALVLAAAHWMWAPSLEPAPVMAFPLPDKPSIVVLPFRTLSDESQPSYLADGFVETLTTELARLPNLFVAARHAAFAYKGRPDTAQQIGAALGVAHVLEGSLQRSGDRVRVHAHLIQTTTGRTVWTERYDEAADDLFRVQDALAERITVELEARLAEGHQVRAWRAQYRKAETYALIARSLDHFRRFTRDDNVEARRLAAEASALDMDAPGPSIMLAWTHVAAHVRPDWSKDASAELAAAEKHAEKALSLDPDFPDTQVLLGRIAMLRGDSERAVALSLKGVELGPSNADVHATAALTLLDLGRAAEALPLIERAMRLSPHYPAWYPGQRGRALAALGRCLEAITFFREWATRATSQYAPLVGLAYCQALTGREEDARQSSAEAVARLPGLTLSGRRRDIARLLLAADESSWQRVASALRAANLPEPGPPLPDKPSLAVLPFRNLSGDPEQDYLADGFVETLTTDLARLPNLFVAARHAAFAYKGKAETPQQIGAALGVAHVLEGSIQRAGDRVRVNAQLIDARTGQARWTERFEEAADDLFRVQDALAYRVTTELLVELVGGPQIRDWRSRYVAADHYVLFARAVEALRRFTPEDNLKARRFARELAALDPHAAGPLELLAWSHYFAVNRPGWGGDPAKDLPEAERLAGEALSRDDRNAVTWNLLAQIALTKGDRERAIRHARKGIELGANDADAYAGLAWTLMDAGESPAEALPLVERAMRLSPHYPAYFPGQRGRALAALGRCEEAIPWLREEFERLPRSYYSRFGLTYCHALLGREDDARKAAAALLERRPGLTLEGGRAEILRALSLGEDSWPRVADALRLAGVPDQPAKAR